VQIASGRSGDRSRKDLALRAGTKEDLAFATKVFDLGEYDRAAKMCCDLIQRLGNSPEHVHAVNDFRSLLIRSMMEVRRSGEPWEPMLEELDCLFAGYLTVKDRVSAAGTLLQKAQFLEDLDWPGAFEASFKAIDLFAKSTDENLLREVRGVYDFLFAKLDGDDTRFYEVCVDYARFLENPVFDAKEGVSAILEIDEVLDGRQNRKAIEIIDSFLSARSQDVSGADREHLRARLAANHLVIGEYKAAVEVCTSLLIDCGKTSRLDYTLWCGEAFMKLDRHDTAAMFFREVIRALRDHPDDSRAASARDYLDLVASSADQEIGDGG
jgi:tetratricopeptide (TPR) repeat protein